MREDKIINVAMGVIAGTLFALAAYATIWLGSVVLGFALMTFMALSLWGWAEMTS